MDDQSLLLALIILVVILAVAWAYNNCKLNQFLPPKQQKTCGVDNFVGAMAQTPPLVPCAFPTSPDWRMNRCNYA